MKLKCKKYIYQAAFPPHSFLLNSEGFFPEVFSLFEPKMNGANDICETG